MKIFNQTKLKLSPFDALKALLGKTVHISTEIEVSAEVEVKSTSQSVHVDALIQLDSRDVALAAITEPCL